jgi:hypothetical protein
MLVDKQNTMDVFAILEAILIVGSPLVIIYTSNVWRGGTPRFSCKHELNNK